MRDRKRPHGAARRGGPEARKSEAPRRFASARGAWPKASERGYFWDTWNTWLNSVIAVLMAVLISAVSSFLVMMSFGSCG